MTTPSTPESLSETLQAFADEQLLGPLLARLSRHRYFLIHHWQQGEFHHDYILILRDPHPAIGRSVLVVSTNCNAGIKTVMALADVPSRWALWGWRCPDNPEFEAGMPEILGEARGVHWFEPCLLLLPDARSEYRPEARARQRGGGWILLGSDDA